MVTVENAAVGQRLKALRETLGLKREYCAWQTAMSAENWRQYETGRNGLSFELMGRMAQLFGVSLGDLAEYLWRGGEMPRPVTSGDAPNGGDPSGNANRLSHYIYYGAERRPLARAS